MKYSVDSHQTGIESETTNQDDNNNSTDDNRPLIWLRVPFLGVQGEFLVKKLIKKIQRNLTKQVKFIVIYQTKKVSYFLPKKDKIPDASRSNLIYEFVCPGCNAAYIGKTERNLKTRVSEHLDPHKSPISQHLNDCENVAFLHHLNNLYDNLNDQHNNNTDKTFSHQHFLQTNTKIIHSLAHNNSNLLLFLEALHIKYKKPELNSGLKASKELVIFP